MSEKHIETMSKREARFMRDLKPSNSRELEPRKIVHPRQRGVTVTNVKWPEGVTVTL
jgi:hypothetical protein